VDIRVDDARNPFVELRRLLNITQGAPARHTTRAEELSKAGRHAEAIAEQKKALEIQPHHDRWLYALAQRHVRAGEYATALGPLSEALAMHPNLKGQLATDSVFEPMKPFAEFQRLVAR
jgi:tetratricopeptide (TPR) repeat protein